MQTPANFHWVKLFILVLLPFLSGVSLPVYACSPEARIALSHLQKSAKARISAEIWFAQIVDEASFPDLEEDRKAANHKIIIKNLWKAFFSDKQSLVYLKQYLASVKFRPLGEMYRPSKTFILNGKEYIYSYIYPFPVAEGERGSACQIAIIIEETESGMSVYTFDLVNGKMKLIGN